MANTVKPMANSTVVLREEFDDWALLIDVDTGTGFGLNPVGVFVWKCLDGQHTVQDIISELNKSCKSIPEEVESHVEDFVQSLVERGLVGQRLQDV